MNIKAPLKFLKFLKPLLFLKPKFPKVTVTPLASVSIPRHHHECGLVNTAGRQVVETSKQAIIL